MTGSENNMRAEMGKPEGTGGKRGEERRGEERRGDVRSREDRKGEKRGQVEKEKVTEFTWLSLPPFFLSLSLPPSLLRFGQLS